MRLLQVCDDDLLHSRHRLRHPFGFFRVRVAHQLPQLFWDDLPRQTEFILLCISHRCKPGSDSCRPSLHQNDEDSAAVIRIGPPLNQATLSSRSSIAVFPGPTNDSFLQILPGGLSHWMPLDNILIIEYFFLLDAGSQIWQEIKDVICLPAVSVSAVPFARPTAACSRLASPLRGLPAADAGRWAALAKYTRK